jgi:hypothetical protein
MSGRVLVVAAMCVAAAMVGRGEQPPAATPAPAAGQAPIGQATAGERPTNLGTDANGNPLRFARKTGHVSNYDEAKVGRYTLPDPLVLANGKPVADAATWTRFRRPEILHLYETEIYGRTPARTPTVTWTTIATDPKARDGAAVMKNVVGRIGDGENPPHIRLTVYTPAQAKGPVPLILLVNFGGGPEPPPLPPGAPPRRQFPSDPPVAAEILARGWGYATVGYLDIQPDRADAWTEGVIGRTLALGQTQSGQTQPGQTQPGQTQPGPDEWGTIGAWSWGVSRIIDHLETDRAVDAKRIAIFGHSRLGKTVLWASAQDQRIAAVFSSCAGEMGSALARRDWGETVDDMAQNFPWQFGSGIQKWPGRWQEMPVDAHMLIALSAPRPVFITGGTTDQWADPVGEFLATSAAGPVYKLLGKKDLGVTALPPLDTPITAGDLGWHYHTGGHTATPEDWKAFLTFLGKYFG